MQTVKHTFFSCTIQKNPQAKTGRGRTLPEKFPWIAKLMPVARCNVRLYRNMLATDLLQLIVAPIILQQVTQNNKLLKSKAFNPAERTAALSCVHGSLYARRPNATPLFGIY